MKNKLKAVCICLRQRKKWKNRARVRYMYLSIYTSYTIPCIHHTHTKGRKRERMNNRSAEMTALRQLTEKQKNRRYFREHFFL